VLSTSESSKDMPTLKEAMASPDRDKWMSACLDEIVKVQSQAQLGAGNEQTNSR